MYMPDIVYKLIYHEFTCCQWLEEEFLGYMEKWEQSVAARPGFSQTDKNKMMLSEATKTGLKFTGNQIAIDVRGV